MNSLQTVGWPFANTYMAKVWSIPNFPVFNIDALLEANRRNAAAWTQANRVVFDAAMTLAQRKRDLLESNVLDYTEVASDVFTAASGEERVMKQIDGAVRISASNLAHFVELSDIAVKTNVSAADILNARFREMFDEFKTLFAGRGKAATSAERSIEAEPVAIVEEATVIEDVATAAIPIETDTPRYAPSAASAAKASKASASRTRFASKTTARSAKVARRHKRR